MISYCHLFVSENQFIIVGGHGNSGPLSSVEALDENQHLTCNIPSYPMAMYVVSSTVTSSGILVCGGYSSGSRKDCYEYRSSSNSWRRMPSMMTERSYFDMLYLRQKIYAVGGWGVSGSLNSMETFDPQAQTWTQQLTPFNVYGHCIAQLSPNKLMVIGGKNNVVSKKVMTKISQSNNLIFYISIPKVIS